MGNLINRHCNKCGYGIANCVCSSDLVLSLQAKTKSLSAANAELKAENSDLQKQVADLAIECGFKELKEENAELKAKVQELTAELNNKKITYTTDKIITLEQSEKELKKCYDGIKSSIEVVRKQRDVARQSEARLKAGLEKALGQLDNKDLAFRQTLNDLLTPPKEQEPRCKEEPK
jgi:chromosome segregation ATPase